MKVKKLNIKKIIGALLVVIGIAIFTTLGTKVYFDFFKDNSSTLKEEKNLHSIDLYGYTLKESDTKIYKEYYNELKDILSKKEIDYEKYTELLSKLFIIDFYTLNNKIASTDIGSLEFVHPSQLENFKLNAGDTMYKYVENNIYKDRDQKLPEVKEVIIESIKDKNYRINNEKYDGYEVQVTWEYTEDLGYETSKTLTLIKDKNILYVVEGK